MSSAMNPYNDQVLRSSSLNPVIPQTIGNRNAPLLPPRPASAPLGMNSYGLQSPYSSGYGYGTGYGSMGYRSPMYNSYGYGGSYGYGNMGMYGMDSYSNFGPRDDTERRFVQFAEESSRNTFANVESIVRAVNSISMMLDNTFFAMTSSFRAVLSVAENFGRLRNMFGHIWYSLNIFRLFRWLYRRLLRLMGYKFMDSATTLAWKEAYNISAGATADPKGGGGRNWPTIAFFGVLISAPYFISKFLLPKYEDKYNPEKWKTPGVKAKVAFDFAATNPNELSLRVNDELLLAPTYIQEEMKLINTGWAFAIGNGKSGLVPLNYLVLGRRPNNGGVLKKPYNLSNNNNQIDCEVPVPTSRIYPKSNVKRVSFGENQIIESNGMERIVKIPDTDNKPETINSLTEAPTEIPKIADLEGKTD